MNLAILNAMADGDFRRSVEKHVSWGLRVMDLKDSIHGKSLLDLSDEEARSAAALIRDHGLSVYCLSSTLFDVDIEVGEAGVRKTELDRIGRLIELAGIFQPHCVRLLAARSRRRPEFQDCVDYIDRSHPWLYGLYAEAARRISAAGYCPTLENEAHRCLLATPEETVGFLKRIEAPMTLTWDIQNMWQMGSYPSLASYHTLKPWIGYVHLKGGREDPQTRKLKWRSALGEATWPVQEIAQRVIADNVSPVLCLNPSHGEGPADPHETERGIAYLRERFPELL